MIYLIAIAAFAATLLGGLFALRFKDKLHLILGFSAGAVIGVAFFDLLPEALSLGSSHFAISTITSIVALGFIIFMVLDRIVFLHSHEESRGHLGAGSLSIHSFLDGLAIGLAFHIASAVGIIVAVAVVAHDFSDGINTVNLILRSDGNRKKAFGWLAIDAIAPILGIAAASFLSLPEYILGAILGLFCGFFLYIGASDLLPESHHSHPTLWTSASTVFGAAILYAAIRLAGI